MGKKRANQPGYEPRLDRAGNKYWAKTQSSFDVTPIVNREHLQRFSHIVANADLEKLGEEGSVHRQVGKTLSNLGFSDAYLAEADKTKLLNKLSDFRMEIKSIDKERADWGSGLNELIGMLNHSVSFYDSYSDEKLRETIREHRNNALEVSELPEKPVSELNKNSDDFKQFFEDMEAESYQQVNSNIRITSSRSRNVGRALNEHYGLEPSQVTLTAMPRKEEQVVLPNEAFPKGSKVQIGKNEFDLEPSGFLSVNGRFIESMKVVDGKPVFKMFPFLKNRRIVKRQQKLLTRI